MPQRIFLSEPLRKLTNADGTLEVNAATIGEAVAELQTRFPGIAKHILDEKGGIHRIADFYVNDEDIRFLQNRETPLNDGDQINIVPAVIETRTAIGAIHVANRLKMGEKF